MIAAAHSQLLLDVFLFQSKIDNKRLTFHSKGAENPMPNKITVKAPAKINLTLDVIGRRKDGYHDLKMIMQTIDLHDKITITETGDSKIGFSMNKDLPDGCPTEDNLVYRAARLMQETYSLSSGFHIKLTKNIPAAAGLAGGSSDCAATLSGINKLCRLRLTKDELCKLGVKLGADVPFCIMKGTMLSEGIGEILTPLADLPPLWVVLVKPNISVSTAYVYSHLNMQRIYNHPNTAQVMDCIERHDIPSLGPQLCNVLETVTIPSHPVIAEVKEFLMKNGAMGSLMSGSGPTVYGLYQDKTLAEISYQTAKARFPKYNVILCQTKMP